MQKQTKTPVFQNSDGTWGHLTKTVNPLICTIEYGSSTGFSSKEEAEKSYQKSRLRHPMEAVRLPGTNGWQI